MEFMGRLSDLKKALGHPVNPNGDPRAALKTVGDCYRWDVEIAWQSVHEILPPTLARVYVVSDAASATLMAGGRTCTGTQRPQSLSMAIGVRSCGMDFGIDTVDADP
jgi:hypothetical protein